MIRHSFKDFLTPVFIIDFGLIILCTICFTYVLDYPKLARVFPGLVLVMVVVAAFFDLTKSVRQVLHADDEEIKENQVLSPDTTHKLKVVYLAVLMFVFSFLMLFFGYILGTLLFLFFSGWTLGYRNIKRLTLSTLIITASIYLIFGVIMDAFLPKGIIFSILGE